MDLLTAQNLAIEKLELAFNDYSKKVYIIAYDGVFSVSEALKKSYNTPSILVSPLNVNDNEVRLATYIIFKSTDKNVLDVIDKTNEVLRSLPGEDGKTLTVTCETLFDTQALKSGIRLWVSLVKLPHLAFGVSNQQDKGPVALEKERIKAIMNLNNNVVVATSKAEISKNLIYGNTPFLTIESGEGLFEQSQGRTIKYSENGSLIKKVIKGVARYPLVLKAYGKSAAEAESLLWDKLPFLPNIRKESGVNIITKVVGLEIAKEEKGAMIASVTLNLEVPAILNEALLPLIKNVKVEGI
ncbi:MAG: hypothetical protein ACPKOI_05760 [Pleomorphochaeta sp.]